MTLKAVFFDLDGTLLDTSKDLGAALNATLSAESREPLSHEIIRPHVSNGANALIRLGFGDDLSPERQLSLRQQLLHHYTENIAEYSQPFDGIEALIAALHSHGILWGIVTNKPWTYTELLMAHFEFASAPSATICPDHVSQAKPAAEPLELACQQSGCNTSESIYIGDHLRDIECGINAGTPTIAVGYGFTDTIDEHEHWGATHSVRSASEIWPLLRQYL